MSCKLYALKLLFIYVFSFDIIVFKTVFKVLFFQSSVKVNVELIVACRENSMYVTVKKLGTMFLC